MKNPIWHYWNIRLSEVKQALETNRFGAYVAENSMEAKRIVLEEIIPEILPATVSWGGSMTLTDTGIYDSICNNGSITVLDTFDKKISKEESLERRRQAMMVDLFITGTNAITETGKLVNLDMIGNRVAGITFGPKNVIILAGRNKIVPDIEEAISRVKNYAAPANVMRLDKKNPCLQTSHCEECNSPERICNSWSITEKSFPKGRIRVVLINEDLGL
ncbi:MAG: lactate utilization protein [Desulfobacterium sp.]|nr:lactate utilization protein [Desulfobacterium sp.]